MERRCITNGGKCLINGAMEKEWKFYYGDHETWGDPRVGKVSLKEATKGENPDSGSSCPI